MAGFFGKMYVLVAATQAGLTWLAVVAVLASVVSCYYYIRVVKVMYFDEPAQPFDTTPAYFVQTGVAISSLATIGFFLIPTPLVIAAKVAAEALLN